MAEITITIPDGIVNRVLDGVAKLHNYESRKIGAETKAQFGKRMVRETIKGWVLVSEINTAKDAQEAASDSEITIS